MPIIHNHKISIFVYSFFFWGERKDTEGYKARMPVTKAHKFKSTQSAYVHCACVCMCTGSRRAVGGKNNRNYVQEQRKQRV